MAKKVNQSVSAKMRSIQNKSTVDVNLKSSDAAIPTDQQARLLNTAVTHTGSVVTPASSSTQSTWQQVPDGMSEFIQNLSADAGLTTINTNILWSEDGTNLSGKTSSTLQNASTSSKTSTSWFPVGGSFYKAEIFNGDAAPHTCSANIKFRA